MSVAVRARPGAGRTRVGGRYEGPHGPALIVAVGAPAVDGKATEAVRRALAEALGVRAGAVALKLGATSRDKVFTVDGDVGAEVAALRDGAPGRAVGSGGAPGGAGGEARGGASGGVA